MRSLRPLLEFLELEWDDACLRPESREGSVMTASSIQVRQPVYRSSVDASAPYREHLQPFIDGIESDPGP